MESGKSTLKILLVEDDRFNLQTTTNMLRDNGYEVITATNATDALKVLDKNSKNIGLAILDIKMAPGKNFSMEETKAGHITGIVLGRVIKEKYPKVSIIGMSAHEEKEVCDWFHKSGFVYLLKPIMPSVIISCIEQAATKLDGHLKKRAFIVHGHDNEAKYELKNYLQNTLDLGEPIILHEQPSLGRTIIEKFEEESQNIDLVFVLLTPDDKGSDVSSTNDEKRRARQNVIFEMGYFFGKLQRRQGKIILLYKGDIELPSDISGIVYIDISKGIKAAGEDIRRELKDWL
jgi:CheY-like chemotaxis protein